MRVTRLILSGYRRFRLRNIQHFEYTPHEKTQVILGTNAAGKSSLLYMLSPMPANKNDFYKGGYKILECEHNNSTYRLSSLFEEEKNRFLFEKDGEQLNQSETISIYAELVKQYFGYTNDLHLLMIGKTRFSSMSVNDRRLWFSRINEADYTYAIRYYKELCEQIRDLQGSIKRYQAQLTSELDKRLNEQQENLLRQEITELNTLLTDLIDHRPARLQDPRALEAQLQEIERDLLPDLQRLENAIERYNGDQTWLAEEKLESEQIDCRSGIQTQRSLIGHYSKDYEVKQKLFEAATANTKENLEALQKAILDHTQEMESLQRKLRLPLLRFQSINEAHQAFTAVSDRLLNLNTEMNELPSGMDYGRAHYQALLEQQPQLEQQKLKAAGAIETLKQHKKHLEEHRSKGSVVCPKCQHNFTPYYDDQTYQALLIKIENAMTASKQADKVYKQVTDKIVVMRRYYELFEQYRAIFRGTPTLSGFWGYLESQNVLQPGNTIVQMSVQMLTLDFSLHLKIDQLSRLIQEKEKSHQFMTVTPTEDIQRLQKEMEITHQRLLQSQNVIQTLTEKLQTIENILKQQQAIRALYRKIVSWHRERQSCLLRLSQDQMNASVDEIIHNLRLTIIQHERTLSQAHVQASIIEKLQQQIKSLEEELELLKLAQKALSPKEGLIAKGMTGFINHFLREMSRFISRIWLYPLSMEAIAMNDDQVDLDYRFPVVMNNELPAIDVTDVSAGMAEVIDLAFVCTSMKYLGMSHYPVFLDEFAKSLDPAHRQAAYQAINTLIEDDDYSQVFLVSHYQDGYSSLSDSEILVLCDNNVQIPKDLAFNKHVTIQ